MGTPKSLITQSRIAQDSQIHVPFIFQRTEEWEGIKVGHYRLSPGQTPSRLHRTHQVFVPLAGSITLFDHEDDGRRVVRRRTVGEISVTPAGLRYSAEWEEDLEYVSVFLTQDFIARATVDFEANQNAKLVMACGPQDLLVRSIAQAVAAEIDSGQPSGRVYLESLVNTLAVHLMRHYSTESLVPDLSFGGLPAHKLRRAHEFIDANLESDLTLTEIAEAVDLSQYHFARAFKQTTGQTPIQFLMQRRVELAKQLLRESDLPIVEISLRSGFKNQSHFTTLFRRLTAVTPKAYRNEVRQ